MKKLILLVAIVALLALGLPGLVGIMAEKELYKQLDLVDDNPVIHLSISNYDRGWFSSEVTYEYGLTDSYLELLQRSGTSDDQTPDQQNADQNDKTDWREIAAPLEFISRVTHGPVGLHEGLFFGLLRSHTTTGPDNPRVNEFLKATNLPYLLEANSTTGFTGNTDFDAHVPPIQAEPDTLPADTQLRSIEFTGLTLNGNYNRGSSQISANSESQSLSVVADNLSFAMEGFALTSNTTLTSTSLPTGTVQSSISSISMFDGNSDMPERIEVKGLGFNADTTAGDQPDTANITASYFFEEAGAAGESVTDAELTMIFKNISVAAMENYGTWNQQLVTIDSEDPNAIQNYMQGLNPIAHEFSRFSPSMKIDPLRFTTSGETFTSDLSLNLDGTKLPAADSFDMTNIPMWLEILSGEAGASISETLATTLAVASAQAQLQEALGDQQGISASQIEEMAAAQAPILIETFVQQGMIARSEGRLAAKVSYKDGELLLNGQPMPLGALMGAM